LAKDLEVSKDIQFLGNIAHPTAMEYLKKATIFCLPSMVEGFGLVTIEAMAAGTPYVNSQIPPTVEITHQGKGGLLFTPKDYRQLAKELLILLTDKKLYERKTKEGVTLARDYDWNVVNSQTEALFARTITSYHEGNNA
jgi:glycosyltransferase involved in cell wall biosynthesis